jgi:hypothetical protein
MKETWRLCSAGVGLSFVWLKGSPVYRGVLSYQFPYKRSGLQIVWIYYLGEDEVIFSELLHERMLMINQNIRFPSTSSEWIDPFDPFGRIGSPLHARHSCAGYGK